MSGIKNLVSFKVNGIGRLARVCGPCGTSGEAPGETFTGDGARATTSHSGHTPFRLVGNAKSRLPQSKGFAASRRLKSGTTFAQRRGEVMAGWTAGMEVNYMG